jgi:hypothetical protein
MVILNTIELQTIVFMLPYGANNMFETYPEARLPPSLFFPKDTIRWAFIEQTNNVEWFYVTRVLAEGDDCRFESQYLIPDVPNLLGLIEATSETAWIKSIQIVSPGWINGTDGWLMQKLTKLICVQNGATERHFYEVAGAGIYPKSKKLKRLRHGEILWRTTEE